MLKEDKENFKNSAKCWISDNNYNDIDVKVREEIISILLKYIYIRTQHS